MIDHTALIDPTPPAEAVEIATNALPAIRALAQPKEPGDAEG